MASGKHQGQADPDPLGIHTVGCLRYNVKAGKGIPRSTHGSGIGEEDAGGGDCRCGHWFVV